MNAYPVKPLAIGLAAAAFTLFSSTVSAQWGPPPGSMMWAPAPQWAPNVGQIQRPMPRAPYARGPWGTARPYGEWAQRGAPYQPQSVRTGPWIWPQAGRQVSYQDRSMPRAPRGYGMPVREGFAPGYDARPYAQAAAAPGYPWMAQGPRYASPEGRVWRRPLPPRAPQGYRPYYPAPYAQHYYRPPMGYGGYPPAYAYTPMPAPWVPQRPAMAPWQMANYARPPAMPPRPMHYDRRGYGYPAGKAPFDLVYHRGKAYAFPSLDQEPSQRYPSAVQGQDLGYRGWQFGTERPASAKTLPQQYPDMRLPASEGIAQTGD